MEPSPLFSRPEWQELQFRLLGLLLAYPDGGPPEYGKIKFQQITQKYIIILTKLFWGKFKTSL